MKRIVLFSPLMLRSIKVQEKEYTLYDAACDALALRVQPSGAMSWVTWQKREGKTRRVTLGRFNAMTLDEARTAARAHAHAGPMDAMQLQAASRPCLTFSALAKLFITEKSEVYSEGGLASFRIYLRNQLLPAFGSKPVNRITTAEVAQWFHMFSRTSPGGANQALGHFTTLMNWGQSKGHLPEAFNNPARPVKRNRRAARGRVLSAEQLRSLAKTLHDAPARHDDAVDAIMIILLTGCRSGEILRLKWSEVRANRLALGKTKTGPREVILTEAVKARLDNRRAGAASDYVFPSKRNPRNPVSTIDGVWKTIKRLAGLPEDFRLHDLRHTYASHSIMSGETLAITGKLLGHKSARSTEVYAHLDASHLSRMADKASRLVELAMK